MSPSSPPSDPPGPEERPSEGSNGGFVPYTDPVVLALVIVLVGTVVVAAGGMTAGPILAGNESDGVVFPVGELFNDTDEQEPVQLHVEANRSDVRVNEPVAVHVSDAAGDPVASASVTVAGDRHPVDSRGNATVTPKTVGDIPVVASAPATNETTYADATLTLSVDRAQVDLAVRTNRSAITVDDPLEIRLLRGESDEPVDGTLRIDGTRHEVDETGRVVVHPDRAGELVVVGNRSMTETETYRPDEAVVDVERRTVRLVATSDPDRLTVGENVTVSIVRNDTGTHVDGTVHVDNRSVETTAGRATIAIDTAGEHDVRVTSPSTRTERYEPATTSIEVRRQSVPLSVVVDRTVTTSGGNVTAQLFRADDRTPVEGTVTVNEETHETDANGTVRLQLNGTDSTTLVGSAPDTDRETFEAGERTIELSGGAVNVSALSAPDRGAPGERIRINATVENVGTEPAEDTIVYRLDGDLRHRSIVSLAPDEQEQLSFEVTLPDSTGTVVGVLASGTDEAEASVRIDDADTDGVRPVSAYR